MTKIKQHLFPLLFAVDTTGDNNMYEKLNCSALLFLMLLVC